MAGTSSLTRPATDARGGGGMEAALHAEPANGIGARRGQQDRGRPVGMIMMFGGSAVVTCKPCGGRLRREGAELFPQHFENQRSFRRRGDADAEYFVRELHAGESLLPWRHKKRRPGRKV